MKDTSKYFEQLANEGNAATQREKIEVVVIHHTQCGTGVLADDAFNSAFAELTGADPDELRHEAVTDPYASVRIDVDRLRSSPLLPSHFVVSGHVYDVETGRVETVVPA